MEHILMKYVVRDEYELSKLKKAYEIFSKHVELIPKNDGGHNFFISNGIDSIEIYPEKISLESIIVKTIPNEDLKIETKSSRNSEEIKIFDEKNIQIFKVYYENKYL